jgi:hypothetical protein
MAVSSAITEPLAPSGKASRLLSPSTAVGAHRHAPMDTSTPKLPDRWFYRDGIVKRGPFLARELRDKIASREVPVDSLVQCEGTDKWRPAAEVAELLPNGFMAAGVAEPAKHATAEKKPRRASSARFQDFADRHPVVATGILSVVGLGLIRGLWVLIWWAFFAKVLSPLEGRVSCDGVPVAEGNIVLEPVDARGVPSRSATLKDGGFQLTAKNGVAPGTEYLVRIEAFRPTGKKHPGVKPGEFAEEYEQFVLPAFNQQSGTRITVTRELTRNGLQLNVQGLPPQTNTATDTVTTKRIKP